MTETTATTYDVIAVDLDTKRVTVMDTAKNARNAEAIVNMAVIRRGVDECFYTVCEAGKYRDGDTYGGAE